MSHGNETETKDKHDRICVPCSRGDEQETATQFCLECQECMCDLCVKFHKKNKATVQHQITRIDEIRPIKRHRMSFSSDELDIEVTCQEHNYKKFKYICRTHKKLCCSRCVIEDHRSCEDVLHLSDYTAHKEYKERLRTNELTLTCFKENAQMLITHESRHIDFIRETEKREAAKGLTIKEKILSQIHTAFAEREKLIKEKSDLLVDASEKLQESTRKSVSVIESYQALQDRAKTHDSHANRVVTVMTVAKNIDSIRADLEMKFSNISKKRVRAEVQTGEPGKSIPAITDVRVEMLPRKVPQFIGIPVLSKNLKVTTKNKSQPPCLRECCILDCGTVIATHEAGKVLRLFDTNDLQEMSSFEVDSEPCGLAKLTGNRVAVSLPEKKQILVLKFQSKKLTNESTIETKSECWGIATYTRDGNSFIAAYSKPKLNLNLISVETKQTEVVGIKINNRVSLSHVSSIAADEDIGQIYLSCSKENKIFACNFGGILLWQVSHMLHTPMGLCVDTSGTLNVCSYGTHKILHISSDGETVCAFIGHEHLNGPVAMAILKDNVVVCDHDPGNVQIKMFSLQ